MGSMCCSKYQPPKASTATKKKDDPLPSELTQLTAESDDKHDSFPSSSSSRLLVQSQHIHSSSTVKRVSWKNSFELVWIDDELFKCETSKILLEQAAASIMGDTTPFEELAQCKVYLENTNRNFVVIISGKLGEQFMQLIHDLDSVKHIFIFCVDISYHKRWSTAFCKVEGCFENSCLLFRCISERVHRSFIQQHSLLLRCPQRRFISHYQPYAQLTTIFNPSNEEQLLSDSSVDTHKRYLSLILIDIILRMPCNETSSQDTQHVFQNLELTTNNVPEEYHSKHAIWLFIKQASLQAYLAGIFRIENIVSLYCFRHFIIDLQQQILASESLQCTGLVYHGRSMTLAELNKLYENVNKLTSLNGFLLGTTIRDVGITYASGSTYLRAKHRDTEGRRNQGALHAVLFEIEMDGCQTFYHFKNRVLLPLGIIFKIKQVSKSQNIHVARLIVTTDAHPDWGAFMTYYRKEIGSVTSPLTLADILSEMNECQSANYFYKICLKEHICPKASVYNNVGCMYYIQGKYSQAAKYMKKVSDMCLKSEWLHLGILSATYNNLAMIYHKLGNFPEARDYCIKALTFKLCHHPIDNRSLAIIYFNIGLIDYAQQQFESARHYFMEAYTYQQIIGLPQYHPDVLRLTVAMADNYQRMNDIIPAYGTFEIALGIASNSLSPDHPDINRIQGHFNHLTPIRDLHVRQWMSSAPSQLSSMLLF